MTRYASMVLANPVPGREDAFNDWYTHVHIPDVLTIDGIVAATRYRLVAQRGGDPAIAGFSYLTIYEIETDDLRRVFRTLVARMGTALMPMSDAIAPERAFYDWEVLGPRVLADRAGVAAAAGARELPDAAVSEESA
ncbi:hypothetical protein O4H66_13335 [Comamonadaceae bacterium G21597-S1]|nr:hypothetical protein [Comamonadaceae bacterium G21597-S1]